MDAFADWRVPVTIRPLTGSGSLGPVYGETVVVPAVVELTNRLVVTPDKREVTATFTVQLDRILPGLQAGSLVDVGEGVERESLLVTHYDHVADEDLVDLEGTVIVL